MDGPNSFDIDLSIQNTFHDTGFDVEHDDDEPIPNSDTALSLFNKTNEDVCYGFESRTDKSETTVPDDLFMIGDSDLGSASSLTLGGQYGTDTSAHLSLLDRPLELTDGTVALAPQCEDVELFLQPGPQGDEDVHITDQTSDPTEREKK